MDWVANYRLASGVVGIAQTLALMRYLINRDAGNEYIRRFALDLVRTCAGHDWDCEIEKVFEYVRDKIKFRRDPVGIERVQDAIRTIKLESGDCDDKVVLLGTLLSSLGHRVRFVVCGSRVNQYSHVYLEVYRHPFSWIALDPSNEKASVGWYPKTIAKAVYPV